MVECVHETETKARRSVVEGGMLGLKPPYPIYFHDEDYRAARHSFVRSLVLADEEEFRRFNKLDDPAFSDAGGHNSTTIGDTPVITTDESRV
jgi:hypothetical protein